MDNVLTFKRKKVFQYDMAESVKKISEFSLIRKFVKLSPIKNNSVVIVPSGDDAFVGKIGKDKVVITTDTMVENVDFHIEWYKRKIFPQVINFRQLGIKLARINLSDLFSMGHVKPLWAVGTFCLNEKMDEKEVNEIFLGVRNELKRYGCQIVGGDISKSKEVVLSLTLIGKFNTGEVKLRNSFEVGDYICVTGKLGDSLGGLKILLEEKKFSSSKNSCEMYLIKKHLYPEINFKVIRPILKYLSSLTDLSDGLYKSLELMCEYNKKIFVEIDAEKIPISKQLKSFCLRYGYDYKKVAIEGGEDYQFLFTVNEKFLNNVITKNNISVIGRVGGVSELGNNNRRKFGSGRIFIRNFFTSKKLFGYDHFSKR